MIHGFPRIQVE